MKRVTARVRSWGLGVGGTLALAWLALAGSAALVAPWLPFQRRQDLSNIRAAPSWAHPFGTDSRGIDMVARVLDGARVSLLIGLASSLLGLLLGAVIGIIAGYRRGQADRAIVVGLDVFAAFPAFVAASLASLVWGQSLPNLMFVLGVLTAPVFARVTRSVTLPLAERDFILAARMIGARHRRVMVRELLPNIAVPLLSYALLATGIVIAVEGALLVLRRRRARAVHHVGQAHRGRAGARRPLAAPEPDPVGRDRAHRARAEHGRRALAAAMALRRRAASPTDGAVQGGSAEAGQRAVADAGGRAPTFVGSTS